MATLILTPDQPCNWHEITTTLQGWNPSIQRTSAQDNGHFNCTLPDGVEERATALFDLQKMLTPLNISFSLEINP